MADRVFYTIACAVLGGCILAGAACLIVMWPWQGPYLPPIGQELSTVEGVSIVRIGPTGGRNSRSGSSKRKAYINAEGIDLLTFLGKASGNHDPIIVLKELPRGQYRVSAQADQDGREALAKMVCHALSESFDCRVTRRAVELDVAVMDCDDRRALSLTDGTDERGFYRHSELLKGAMQTSFSSTLDSLAWFAGYMSRNHAAQNDVPNRDVLLKKVFVNETGIDGIFQGKVEWDSSNPNVVRSCLEKLGFELTTARRTIPAIVIEAADPNQPWTYLSESDSPSIGPQKSGAGEDVVSGP